MDIGVDNESRLFNGKDKVETEKIRSGIIKLARIPFAPYSIRHLLWNKEGLLGSWLAVIWRAYSARGIPEFPTYKVDPDLAFLVMTTSSLETTSLRSVAEKLRTGDKSGIPRDFFGFLYHVDRNFLSVLGASRYRSEISGENLADIIRCICETEFTSPETRDRQSHLRKAFPGLLRPL